MSDYQAQPGLSDRERLVRIEEIVGRMDQRLFGNGQPGELSALQSRVTILEESRWKLMGVFGALGAAIGSLAALLTLLFHKP